MATPPDLPDINVAFVVVAVLVQYPLMIGLPIALGLWLRRRFGIPLRVWSIGAATFVVSQIVHLPLNAALGLGAGEGPLTHAPLAVVSIALGLTAGLCEELARYGAMRFAMRKQRSWHGAVMFGAGHGGIEAIIFGVLAGFSLVSMLALPLLGDIASTAEAQAAAWSYWLHPWYSPMFAGLERVSAIMIHIGMSVLVMRAVTRRNLLYLGAAIAAHAAIDALVLPAKAAQLGMVWIEAAAVVLGLAALGVALWLREPAPCGEQL